MTERLTSLTNVKAWLGIQEDGQDALLGLLIDGASQLVLQYLGRETFTTRNYTDRFKGNGKTGHMLRNWPILNINSIYVAGTAVVASSVSNGVPGSGYLWDNSLEGPGSIELTGYAFYNGSPSEVIYQAGYQNTDTTTIVASTTVDTLRGQWIADLGVVSSVATFVKVTSAPAAGEYCVDANGSYTFNDTDAGIEVEITYNYSPFAVSNATMEIVGESWRRKDRIGQISKSLGGQETVAFSEKDIPATARLALDPYRRVVPC